MEGCWEIHQVNPQVVVHWNGRTIRGDTANLVDANANVENASEV